MQNNSEMDGRTVLKELNSNDTMPSNFAGKSSMSTKISPTVTATEHAGTSDAACENSGNFIDLPEFVGTQNVKASNNIASQQNATATEPTYISKFIDLPPFDESQMPDLPGSLDPEIEAYLNSTSGGFKYNSERRRLLQTEENDTALSSDNETFAECQSDGFSDTENYRSAINFNTTTSLNNTSNDTTATNKYNFITNFNENQRDCVNISFDEPMDVDISMAAGDSTPTKDPLFESSQFSAQISEISVPFPQYEMYSTDENKQSRNSTDSNGDGDGDSISRITSTITLHDGTIDLDSTPQPNNSADLEQSRHEISLNKSVVLPSQDFEECIKESRITIIKPVLTDIIENDLPSIQVDSVENLNKYDGDVTVEMNTSFGSAKSSLNNSPTFPLKDSTKQLNKFPTSPSVSPNRETRFLEKSENAEQINATRKKSIQATKQNIQDLNENLETTNKRYTFEIPKLTADVAETCVENLTDVAEENKRLKFDMPKSTTDVAELFAESCITNMADVNVKFVTNKRQTFGISDKDNDEGKLDIISSIPSNEKTEKTRRTFNVESNVAATANVAELSTESCITNMADTDKRQTFGISDKENDEGKRDIISSIPSNDKSEETRRTFNVESNVAVIADVAELSTESCITDVNVKFVTDKDSDESICSTEKRRTFDILSSIPSSTEKSEETRRTFNVESNVAANSVNNTDSDSSIVSLSVIKEKEARHSFDVLNIPSNDKLNDTSEPMELDISSSASSVESKWLGVGNDATQIRESLGLNQATDKFPISPSLSDVQKRLDVNFSALPQTTTEIGKSEENLNASSQLTTEVVKSPPLPTVQKRLEENMNDSSQATVDVLKSIDEFKLPPPVSKLKRPSIHQRKSDPTKNSTVLSAKEQANLKDEKDVFMEKFESTPIEDMIESADPFARKSIDNANQEAATDEEFQANNLILNPSDFDFLLTKGNNNVSVYRNSLLLKFDPLFGTPVLANQYSQSPKTPTTLIPTIEEDEQQQNQDNRSYVIIQTRNSVESVPEENVEDGSCKVAAAVVPTSSKKLPSANQETSESEVVSVGTENQPQPEAVKQHAKMSIDVIKDMSMDNDCNKTFENSSNLQSDEKQNNYKMDEMEKKIKNEVLKTEDIEKKLKDAEQREESFIKRITEKDKTITKMNGVIEAYEKAIAELISEKEQLVQGYEKQLTEVKADRDSNYLHLTSLETTYSDLHIKYEKSKEMTSQLKRNEEALVAERRQNLENLRLQEQRYEKMKNHAMQQLEIANKKLETLTKDHSVEVTKLKALLKKEEISRASINEQLIQKSRENAELVKICDELINGQGS